jgi:hypothetical protein
MRSGIESASVLAMDGLLRFLPSRFHTQVVGRIAYWLTHVHAGRGY